mgnify:CR=1 FL=1
MPAPNIGTAGFDEFNRPKEWHEEINPFAAAYRGVTPLAQGQTAAMRPEDYDFFRAMQEAQAQQGAARTGQQTNADAILARALGQGGPSLAEMQLRDATDRLLKQQAGAVGAVRGQNPALTQRLIQQQGAASQQQMAGQAAMLRAQEQQAAQGLAAQAFGQMRGQDQGMFGTAGQGRQSQNALNVQSDLEAQNQNLNRELANQRAIQANQAMQYGADQNAAQRNVNIASGVGQAAIGLATGMPMGGGGGWDGVSDHGFTKGYSGGQVRTDGSLMKPAGAMNGGEVMPNGALRMADGGAIPGVANVPGDSPQNDTVLIAAAPDEIIIPRTKATPDGAYDFVKALQSQSSEDDRMARIFDLQDRLDKLKAGMAYGGKVSRKQGC